jgi:predicted Zn-ribbon and HTH transcriptional regulator
MPSKLLKCLRCAYEWTARAKVPRSCPRCKSYEWQTPRGDK